MPLPIYSSKAPPSPLSAIKCLIAVAAGKGGVGKSSVTVNLALALKREGYQVGILDTDIYGPSVRKMLPENRLPSQKGTTIYPALCSGIKIISMAYFRKDHESTSVRAPIANGLISQFIKNVEWGELDYLLIDFPPGTGDIQLTLSQQMNLTGAIMVTTPQEVAVMDVRRAMHLFDQVKVPIIGIVENMSYYVDPARQEPVYLFGQGGGERLAHESGIPFLGKIPIDPLLCRCGDRGESIFVHDPACNKGVTQAFVQLAEQLKGHIDMMQRHVSDHLHHFELIWKEMP